MVHDSNVTLKSVVKLKIQYKKHVIKVSSSYHGGTIKHKGKKQLQTIDTVSQFPESMFKYEPWQKP